MIYSANSLTGLMAAVRSGLAVTVQAKHAVSEGTEILTPRLDLPELPQIQIVLRNRAVGAAGELLTSSLMKMNIHAT